MMPALLLVPALLLAPLLLVLVLVLAPLVLRSHPSSLLCCFAYCGLPPCICLTFSRCLLWKE